jgi:hypothetical protein
MYTCAWKITQATLSPPIATEYGADKAEERASAEKRPTPSHLIAYASLAMGQFGALRDFESWSVPFMNRMRIACLQYLKINLP